MNISTKSVVTHYVIEISDDDPLFSKLKQYLNGSGKPIVKSKGKLPKSAKRGRKPKTMFYCLEPGCTHAPFPTERGKQVHQARTKHHDPAE